MDELTPITGDLTLNELKGLRDSAKKLRDELRAQPARTTEIAKQVRELAAYIAQADDAIAEIEATDFDDVPEPVTPEPEAPAPAPVVTPEPAPAVADADPEPEAETPEPAPEVEPANGLTRDDLEAALAEQAAKFDADKEAMVAQIREELSSPTAVDDLTTGEGVPEESEASTPNPEVEVLPQPGELVGGAPIFATSGSGWLDNVVVEDRTSLADVADRMRNLNRMAHMIPAGMPHRVNLFRADRLDNRDSVPMLGEDPDANSEILFRTAPAARGGDSIAAAADLSICGDPVEINVQGCVLDDSTPFMDALAGNSVAAQNCIVRWRKPLSVEDIGVGPQLWTACDQADVDPSDRSTWKPLTASLPPCEDYCTAEPFDIIMGLELTMNDQLCRPERVEEMNRWISVYASILKEQIAFSLFDMQVGPDHHFAYDASATAVAGDDATETDARPQLGAVPSLVGAVHALASRSGINRHSNAQEWWVALHPAVLHSLAYDAMLAGEPGPTGASMAEKASWLQSLLAPAGVTNVVLTKEYGPCEGQLYGGYSNNQHLCNIENCDIVTYTNTGTGCTGFAGGNPLPELVTDTRLRFFQPSNWYHGSNFLVDYGLLTSAELVRMNRAEYFGEERHLMFKISDCESLEFVLDIENLCPNGQRIRSEAFFDCGVFTGTSATLNALADGISGVGQINPLQLADMADPDPVTTPQNPSNIQGANPDPGTATGGTIPGGDTFTN